MARVLLVRLLILEKDLFVPGNSSLRVRKAPWRLASVSSLFRELRRVIAEFGVEGGFETSWFPQCPAPSRVGLTSRFGSAQSIVRR